MLRNCLRYDHALAAAVVLFLALQPHALVAQPVTPAAEVPVKRVAPAAPAGTDRSLGALGTRIVTQGIADKGIAACASCHGLQGEGVAASGFPRLAGQSPAYLVRQIESFTQDTRRHPLMSPIAKAMTLEQNMASAFYYASLDPDAGVGATGSQLAASAALSASEPASSAGAQAERGMRLARSGNDAAQIPACANCHGPGGVGEPPAYPYLAGQHESYLVNALNQWKSGQRKSDPSGQMQAIASRLSDADIAAVAAYYAKMPPPSRRLASTAPSTAPAGRGGASATQSQGGMRASGAAGGSTGASSPSGPENAKPDPRH